MVSNKVNKKALVISGGGSKGAYAGGVAEYLIINRKKNYDIFLGTSTGSLLVSHLAVNKVSEIKNVYTNVTQASIFSNCPFTQKTIHGYKQVGINHLNVLFSFIKGSRTFGETKNLRRLIEREISEEIYNEIKQNNKEVVITVSNLSTDQVEYKCISDSTYNDFCDWIWISCNYPPFMSLVTKNGCDYADGGLAVIAPIEQAMDMGATEIDAIILDTEVQSINQLSIKNAFSLLSSTFSFMLNTTARQSIELARRRAVNEKINLKMMYTPSLLTTNSLIFDKEEMTKWWQQGFEYAEKNFEKFL